MPLRVFSARCHLASPLELPPRAGATLATTLRGAYGEALVRMGHGWFRAPRSEVQRRDHPSPFVLRVARRAEPEVKPWLTHEHLTVRDVTLTLALLGRKARAHTHVALEALERAGTAGLGAEHVPFTAELEQSFDGTFAQWTGLSFARVVSAGVPAPRRVRIELVTPMDADVEAFARIVGDVAHDWVQWDLADSDHAETIGRPACDALADRARDLAAEAFQGITIRTHITFEDLGLRRSRRNGRRFPLRGFVGSIELTGRVEAALPWLSMLELRGGGGRKTFGLGEVRVWVGE